MRKIKWVRNNCLDTDEYVQLLPKEVIDCNRSEIVDYNFKQEIDVNFKGYIN